jgi:hypothetical protein
MQNISKQNPLMMPVHYADEVFFTSQYFHKMYRQNSGDNCKYTQLASFNRLIRSIETYDDYIERGDIVELQWKDYKNQTDTYFVSVIELLKSNNYNPVMLINATAQVALTHHLDDEISKKASISINDKTANRIENNQQQSLSLSIKEQIEAIQSIGTWMLSTVIGVKSEIVAAATLSTIDQTTGIPTEQFRLALPSVDSKSIGSLNATKVGAEFGIDAKAVNILLESLGLQKKCASGGWELTEKGIQYGEAKPFSRNGHSSYQVLWNESVFDVLRKYQESLFGK